MEKRGCICTLCGAISASRDVLLGSEEAGPVVLWETDGGRRCVRLLSGFGPIILMEAVFFDDLDEFLRVAWVGSVAAFLQTVGPCAVIGAVELEELLVSRSEA